MDLEIAPLEIKITTNVPNQQLISFTSGLLYHPENALPSNIEKYPYLLSNAYFPEDTLKNMEWDDRISFFFNINTMRNTMANENMEIKEDPQEKQKVENRNIFMLIKYVFPTKYFVHKNIHQTLEYVTSESPERSFFFNPLSQQFSYTKLNDKVYTNVRVTWKNDLLNHPSYFDLVKNTYEFVLKQQKEEPRIAEKYNNYMIEFNNQFRKYIARMLTLLQQYDDQVKPGQKQNAHMVMRIALLTSLFQWINYENTDETFVKIFILNIKALNKDLTNKIGTEYYTPRTDSFVSKDIFDKIEEREGQINLITDPLERKKEKLELLFNKDYDILINDRLLKKLEQNEELKDMINEYSLLFEKTVEDLIKLYETKVSIQIEAVMNFNKYKTTPFIQLLSKPDLIKDNLAYRRYFTNHIQKFVETSSGPTNTLVSGNAKLYQLIHSTDGKDISYFFDFMVYVYEKYILYKTVSAPKNEELVRKHTELIYTGVDRVENRKQVYFIVDCIDGEVNDENKRSLYCPFMNEYMGFLFSDFMLPNTFVRWKAAPYNFILSTSDHSVTESTNKEESPTGILRTSETKPTLTNETVEDNWNKFKSIINVVSREKIINILLTLKARKPTIDESNEFAYIEQNNRDLFELIKRVSKHIKKVDLDTQEFTQTLQKLKEFNSNFKSRVVYFSKLTKEPVSIEQDENTKDSLLENELYEIVSGNAIQFFDQKGGRKTRRKKVKFSRKNNIVFIE